MRSRNALTVVLAFVAPLLLVDVAQAYYTPGLGRFINRDPLYELGDANLYRYVENSPTNFVDPLGLTDWGKAWDYFWKYYWALDDEGAVFARQLMYHYAFGGGKPFKAGYYYLHKTERSWWSGRLTMTHTVMGLGQGAMGNDGEWNAFMRNRPELQEAARGYLCEKAKQYAKRTGAHATVEEYFEGDLGPVRLNRLESMRLTLHGAHSVTTDGYVQKDCKNGETTVEFKYLTFRWKDRGDLHPGVGTQTNDGQWIDDQQFVSVGLGKPFDILISWISSNSLVKVCSGKCEFSGDWPPPASPGDAVPGTRK